MNWNLCESPFTALDKLKIAAFLFREPIWTAGSWVRKYEQMWETKFGANHAIMVSSGSTANELIALRRKWELQQAGEWPRRNKVIFPVNTWISSVSVWIHAGFEPVFVDVSSVNLNVTSETLEATFAADISKSIGTVFYTALLGYFNDLEHCKSVTESFGARFMMDNCEASFSRYKDSTDAVYDKSRSILTLATCSTSIYFSHFATSGTEGGLIFTQNVDEADWFRMMRNHGMTRGMDAKYRNPNVNPDFDFHFMGSNYRSSNLQAYMATLDFERAYRFSARRSEILDTFTLTLDPSKYQRFGAGSGLGYAFCVPLAIPILCHTKEQRIKVEAYLRSNDIGVRPLIGGCLLEHTAFKGYGNSSDFPVAKWSHECGLYLGLHARVTPDMAEELAETLNSL